MHKNFYDKDKIQILHKNKLRFIIIHKSKQKELNNTMERVITNLVKLDELKRKPCDRWLKYFNKVRIAYYLAWYKKIKIIFKCKNLTEVFNL